MCGIVGVVNNSGLDTNETLRVMNDRIIHRGPDDSGESVAGNFGFAMRRLSIIDLAGGHQPIWTDDGVGIIFNGEVYNHNLLRDRLIAHGYKFKTNSDTEVILYMYHKYGMDFVEHLNGMFAIAIVDQRIRRLYLIRDRVGIKPLYYGLINKSFFFASEIKSIYYGANKCLTINMQALSQYLSFRFITGENTIWNQVKKLMPGNYLEYDLETNTYTTIRYWNYLFKSTNPDKKRDYIKEFEELLLNSVKKKLLVSDVPVGIMLSGGLDSSVITAMAHELGLENLYTFSVGFTENYRFNELNYAKMVSERYNTNHNEVSIGKEEVSSFLNDLPYFSDEPLADLASIPLYYITKKASEYVKVVLSGEGGDEVLAGYNFDRLMYFFSVSRLLPNPIKCVSSKILNGTPAMLLQNMYKNGFNNVWLNSGYYMTSDWEDSDKINTEKFNKGETLNSWYSQYNELHPVDQLQNVYFDAWLVEDLLMKADKMSMANSLELRVPYLDHELVEWAMDLPVEYKFGSIFRGFQSKRVLRETAIKRLPREIINRPKQGFLVPMYEWLGERNCVFVEALQKKDSFVSTLIKKEAINNNLRAAMSGDNLAARKIWNLIILEKWASVWM